MTVETHDAPATHLETRAVHGGLSIEHQYGDVALPMHVSVNFEYRDIESTKSAYGYARHRHPTREHLEAALAAVEGSKHALAFSSGIAAIDAILRALNPGDRVVADEDLFGGTYALLERLYAPRGVQVSYVDMSADIETLAAALTERTRIVLLETPTNPFMRIIDIRAVAKLAHGVDATVVVDNTFATPLLQRPLELGADLVVYSTTKYFAGHSDMMGGAVLMNDTDVYERIKYVQYAAGAVPSTFDCWLLARSIKTLAVRVERQCENAKRVALLLSGHPSVEALYYPGLPSHPGHTVAQSQMRDFGAMMSFLPRGGIVAARRIYGRTSVFTRASSLGAVESLIVAPIAGPHIARVGTSKAPPPHLLRLSVGIEHVDDLVADLQHALKPA
jgi:cystathionine gamma-synthase